MKKWLYIGLSVILAGLGLVTWFKLYDYLSAADPDVEADPAEAATEDPDPALPHSYYTGKEIKAIALGGDRPKAVRIVHGVAYDVLREDHGMSEDDAYNGALMITSHGVRETGWFEHFLDDNLFGVNAVGDEPYILGNDAGNPRHFRAYDDIGGSIAAYARLVRASYPSAWQVITTDDVRGYGWGLKHGTPRKDGRPREYYELDEPSFSGPLASIHARVSAYVFEG